MAGMLAYLLADHPDVAKVEPFAEVGAVGPNWPPHGVKVTFTDGSAAFLPSSRTSSPNDDLDAQSDTFNPEDLHVSSVRS